MTAFKYFPEAEYHDQGTQNEPLLTYQGTTIKYYLIEDAIYETFKEEATDSGVPLTEENFMAFCMENQSLIRETFDHTVESLKGEAKP